MTLSIMTLSKVHLSATLRITTLIFVACQNDEHHIFLIDMLNVIMLSAIMLSIVFSNYYAER